MSTQSMHVQKLAASASQRKDSGAGNLAFAAQMLISVALATAVSGQEITPKGGLTEDLNGIGQGVEKLPKAPGYPTRGYSLTSPDLSERETGTPMKVIRYARRIVQKYDRSGNGNLQPDEWAKMQGKPRSIDSPPRDGVITEDELVQHIVGFGRYRRIRPRWSALQLAQAFPPLLQPLTEAEPREPLQDAAASGSGEAINGRPEATPNGAWPEDPKRETKYFVPAASLPQGLPNWFLARDADGDGQLTLAEFAPRPTRSDLDRFARHDANHDGVITAQEWIRGSKTSGKQGTTP